jgi:hypothetical protein
MRRHTSRRSSVADDRIFLAHKPSGLAICLAKMLGNDWRSDRVTEAWNTFMGFLRGDLEAQPTHEEHEAFWKSYMSETDDFVLLREATFNITWTTPSNYLFCKDDYVNADETSDSRGEPPIFKVSFDEGLIQEHRERKLKR